MVSVPHTFLRIFFVCTTLLFLGAGCSLPGSLSQKQIEIAPPSAPQKVDPFPDDRDRDGLLVEEEKKYKTSDLEFDTDHDGLSDYDEAKRWQTDPLTADSDKDGFVDGIEVLNGHNPKEK